MRKILISILVCLLLIGSAFFMVNGISKVNIKGIKGLSEKNGQIEQKISDLSNVISVTYANTESNLKRTANTLQDSKSSSIIKFTKSKLCITIRNLWYRLLMDKTWKLCKRWKSCYKNRLSS